MTLFSRNTIKSWNSILNFDNKVAMLEDKKRIVLITNVLSKILLLTGNLLQNESTTLNFIKKWYIRLFKVVPTKS